MAAVAAADLGLDDLSAHWRLAFISAQDALSAIQRCGAGLRFPPHEVREWASRLEHERARDREAPRRGRARRAGAAPAPALRAARHQEDARAPGQRAGMRLRPRRRPHRERRRARRAVGGRSRRVARAAGWRPRASASHRSCPSIPAPITTAISTAGRALTASTPSSRAAASGWPRAARTTRRAPRRSTGSRTGRTRRSSTSSGAKASRPSAARCSTWKDSERQGCRAQSSHPAPTRRRSSSGPGSNPSSVW